MNHRSFFAFLVTALAIGTGLYVIWYNTSTLVTVQVASTSEVQTDPRVFLGRSGYKKQSAPPFSIRLSRGKYTFIAVAPGARSINKKITVQNREPQFIMLNFEKLTDETNPQKAEIPITILRQLPYYSDSFTASAQATPNTTGGFTINGLNVDLILQLASEEPIEFRDREVEQAKQEFYRWLKTSSIPQEIPIFFRP